MSLSEIADEVFGAETPATVEKPSQASKTASILDSVADEVFEGKPPKAPEPGFLSKAADAVTSAVTAIPKAIATGFRSVGPAVAPGAAAPPKDVALPQGPTPEALKATGRSASVIPEPVAPPPPVPVKLGPVPGLEAVSAEAQKTPLLERVSGAAPGSPLPVPERPAPGGMLGRVAAKGGIVDPEAAKRRAAEAEFAAASVMTKPEGMDPGWWQVQQDIRQANRALDAMPKEFVNRILFGIPNAIKDTFGFDSPQARAPQSTAEAITGGTGDLAGFIVGPAKVAHGLLAGNITKWIAPQAGNALGTIMAKSIANEAATLAVASGLAHAGDVTQADSMKEAFHQLGEHVKGGAVLGATFGGLGNVIPANTLMQRAARLGVGLGVLDVVQGTSPGDDRALAQKIYDYGLNTYFLWSGKAPRAIKASLEAAAAARSKPGAEVTPEQVLKSVLDKATERAAKLKDVPAKPGVPETGTRPAPDLKAILEEELAAATAPLKSAAEVAVEKTGGPIAGPSPVAAGPSPDILLAGGPRPAARPAAPKPAQKVGIPGEVPTIGAGPVRILGPFGRPAEAQPAPVEPEVPAPALKSAQELAEERVKGITRPAPPAPQAPPAAAAAKAVNDRPTTSLSFKEYVEVSGKKWPLTSREPDYARLRFEFDDMKKGLYEARPVGDGLWAVINRKTGEEVDHLQTGAKAQLESNRLNAVVTMDAWRTAQIPQPRRVAEEGADYRATGSPSGPRPTDASRSGVGRGESMKSPQEAPPRTQAVPSQVSIAAPPSVSSATRETAPSDQIISMAPTYMPSLTQPTYKVQELQPPADYDLPAVPLSDLPVRGIVRAARDLTMRMLGGVQEARGPYRTPEERDQARQRVREVGKEIGMVAEPKASYDTARPPFFSALAKAIDQKMPERASAEQIQAIATGPGIKADEVKWTGLEDWLAEQNGPVTKAQVQEFLRDNAVRVEEKVLGSRMVEGPDTAKFSKYTLPGGQNYRELLLTFPGKPRKQDELGWKESTEDLNLTSRGGERGEHQVWRAEFGSGAGDARITRMLGSMREGRRYVVDANPRGPGQRPLQNAGYGSLEEAKAAVAALVQPGYKSPHWDEPNVLASIRFNDRTDQDGKRVLFLEEIQSDWHQAGRRQGYAEQPRFTVMDQHENQRGEFTTRAEAEAFLANPPDFINPRTSRIKEVPGHGVPPAPFAKTWHELAMKRMLRWAAEHGYDKVAWATGEQQAERYDLSKQVQAVEWSPKFGSIRVELPMRGFQFLADGGIKTEADIERYVGKDVAKRLFEGQTQDNLWSRVEGEGLKVGGEGMRGFYDKILPEFAAKYGKKWGATVVESRMQAGDDVAVVFNRGGREVWSGDRDSIPALDPGDRVEYPNSQPVHSIDVTPEMRRSVLIEGQALFSPESPYAASKARARKGATTADRETAQLALFDLEQAVSTPVESVVEKPAQPKRPPLRGEEAGAGVRTVSRMIDEFKDKGFIDFRGQTVREGPEGLRDLAVIGQIARDPRYETFRYFYTKGGEIVGSEAFSSRLPGATNIMEGVQRQPAGGFDMASVDLEIARRRTDQAKAFAGMRRRMERLGADGYYVMHNHPSGRAEPSSEDINTTEYLASKVPGFKGHVVIDSGEFARIVLSDRGHAVATVERLDAQRLDAPQAEDPMLRRVGAQKILSAEDLAQIGRNLKVPDNYVSLVHRDSAGLVRAVQEMPVNEFLRTKEGSDHIRGQQRKLGAAMTFAVFKPTSRTLEQARQFVKAGVLADAIAPGATAAESALNTLQGRGEMPISSTPREAPRDLRTVRVQEEPAPYGDFERLKPETRKKLVDFGREVMREDKADFASWAKAMRERLGEKSEGTLPGAWAALMQEQARTQAKSPATADRKAGKPPEPPKEIPQSAAPLDPPPGMTDPQLKLGLHKDVVDAALDLFKAGKIERDPKMLISDQILEAIRDGKLRIEDMADVLDRRGMTFSDFGAQMFRPAITDAAKRLGALGQLQRRLNELESTLKREADTPGPDGKPGTPGGPDPAKLKTIGDILDAARVLDPKGDRVRNRTMAAALAYWRRADNVRRGLLVTQLATSVRNFTSQVGRLGLDVIDQGLQGGLQRAFGKEVTQHPADSMKAMMDVFRVSPAEAKRRVDALLEGLPREEERLFSNYASDLNRMAKKQGADKAIDAGLRGAEKAVEVLNTFNRFQEYSVRRAVLQAELAARLRTRGIDLEAAIKDQTIRRKIPVADIRAAIEKSLEITFASNPAYGSAGYHFVKWINKTPGATFLIPFPRFMMNAMKFYLEFSPAGFLKFLSEAERQKFRQGDMKTMSRGLLGIGLLSSAYLIRSMQDEDTKWNEVRLPGMERTIDVRPLNPFASYLFVADILHRAANDRLYGGGLATEAVKNILGVNVRGGTGLQAVDQLVDGLRDIGDARALTKYLQGAGGHLVAGLLTPLQQLTDVYAEFDPEAQIMRATKAQPFSGPIKQRFPSPLIEALGGDIGEEKASPTSSESLRRESPGVRQVTGLTLGKAKNDFERELDRLQIPYREVLPSQGDPRLDNMLAAKMGPLAEVEGERLVNSARFQNLGEIGKRLELKAYLERLRKKAKAQAVLDREYREISKEVKAGTSQERLAEIAREEKAGLR